MPHAEGAHGPAEARPGNSQHLHRVRHRHPGHDRTPEDDCARNGRGAGISQRTLNTEARTGIISMTHLDRLLQAQGHGWSALLADISDLCRRGQRYIAIIETIRSKETADE